MCHWRPGATGGLSASARSRDTGGQAARGTGRHPSPAAIANDLGAADTPFDLAGGAESVLSQSANRLRGG